MPFLDSTNSLLIGPFNFSLWLVSFLTTSKGEELRPRTTSTKNYVRSGGLRTAMFTLLGIPRGKVSSCSETSKSTDQVSSGAGSNSAGVLLCSGPQLTKQSTATVCLVGTVRLFIYHSSFLQLDLAQTPPIH